MGITTTYFSFDYSPGARALGVLATYDHLDPYTPVTGFYQYVVAQSQWGSLRFRGFRATSLAYAGTSPSSGLWLIGTRGEVWKVIGDEVVNQDQLPDSGLDGRGLGQPNEIRMIDGQPYVCGYAGQVYTLRGDQWVHMDYGLGEPTGRVDSIDLESIDGTGPDDIYTVGSGGLVAHWDGRAWRRLPALTNVYLARVRCFERNHIAAVGDKGVFLQSDGQSWRIERIPAAEDTPLSDVASFQGRLYVAALRRLFVRDGDAWSEVRHGLPKDKTSFRRLVVGAGRLWSMGHARLNSFDGKKWEAHPDANNG